MQGQFVFFCELRVVVDDEFHLAAGFGAECVHPTKILCIGLNRNTLVPVLDIAGTAVQGTGHEVAERDAFRGAGLAITDEVEFVVGCENCACLHEMKCLLTRVILRIAFFSLCILPAASYANLRAPVHIDRGSTGLKSENGGSLKILGETLEFQCPESYAGKPDFELFAVRACQARVRYRISAASAEHVKLEFIFSGFGNVAWRLRDKLTTTEPRPIKITGRKICSSCPDSMKNLLSASEVISLEQGENELEISYRQALSYDERGHGYFSDGKWTQGFSYELWPIAEWQWAEKASAELKFNIVARSGFLGIGYKGDTMKCFLDENGTSDEIAIKREEMTDILRRVSAVFPLKKSSQRLRCSYGAE